MRNPETNKGTMKMTTKKWLTVLTALLLAVLPIQGMSAANAATDDTTLAVFTIDGDDVTDGDTLIVPGGTTSVTVVATPTDAGATATVSGDTGLVAGDNNVVVEVVAADTITTATYTVNVFVTNVGPTFSHDTSLTSLSVNGTEISPNQIVEVAPLTSAVTVEVVTNDVNATSMVSGALGLVTGLNTVSVTVTAEDGTTTAVYTFKVRVLALSSDVALATFTVNGQAVRSGGRIFLAPETTYVSVVATPSDPTSSVDVTGATGLAAGANTLTVLVTSESGTTATYTVTLNVESPSNISSLAVFKVSGARVTDGSTVIVPSGTTAVAVTAIPSDASANVAITGNADLVIGDNNLSVLVTAEDGTTTTYTATLRVLANDDTSLAVFQYDGSDIADGDSFDLEYGTTSVEITAEPTTTLSTVEILGATELVVGKNTVRVNVTAQDASVKTYRLFFNVAPNTDTTLESVEVAGQDASGGSVTVPAGTRAVSVVPVTTDPFASFTIAGNTDLQAGDNEVVITVTAADGETTEDISITVTVEEVVLSDETGVDSITVAGQDVADGASIDLPFGTRGALVQVITTDAFASYTVEGNVDMAPGENTITITVTAADGQATADYTVTVMVAELSDDSSIALFQINGADVNDGDAITLAYGTTHVNTKVEVTDAGATFSVAGATGLVEGDQDLVVTVTAANGDSATYTVTLTVAPISTNTDLAEENAVVVNGEAIDTALLDAAGAYIDLPLTATTVSISANAADAMSDVFVAGKTVLPGVARSFSVDKGVNEIAIKVIPQAGNDFAKTYVLKIYVGGADATVKTIKVNNTAITLNESNEGTLSTPLANGTTTATVFVDPTVALGTESTPGTKIEIEGAAQGANANTFTVSELATGENTVTVVITPGDVNAEQVSYTITINVAQSSDKRLKTFLVAGVATVVGSTVILAKGSTEVELDGVTESDLATYEVSGGDALVNGLNTLSIVVTAEDGSTQTYTVTAIVPSAVDTIVVTFPKVGVLTVDAKTNAAGNKILAAEVKKIGKKTVAKVTITNNYLFPKEKAAAGTTRATNTQKFFQAAKLAGVKTAKYELVAGAKTQKGTTVTIYYY